MAVTRILYLALVQDRLTTEQRAELQLPNHALHCHQITLLWRGESTTFRAPPDQNFTAFANLTELQMGQQMSKSLEYQYPRTISRN